jgi:hypothetical protein
MAVMNRTEASDPAPTAVDERASAPRRRLWFRRRRPADRAARAGPAPVAAGAVTGVTVLIARVIRLAAAVVAVLIALGIAFSVFKASGSNTIVSHVHDWARTLVGPFRGMFQVHGARGTLALNWGIALIVYLLLAAVLVRLVLTPARIARRRAAV